MMEWRLLLNGHATVTGVMSKALIQSDVRAFLECRG